MVALHKAAILPGYKAGPIFWRDLWLAGKGLDSVRWWRSGANELKASVDRVRSHHACCSTPPHPRSITYGRAVFRDVKPIFRILQLERQACACSLQVDSAKEAAVTEEAIQQADAIAADNADGLGEDRRKAVLAEAEAASAGLSAGISTEALLPTCEMLGIS